MGHPGGLGELEERRFKVEELQADLDKGAACRRQGRQGMRLATRQAGKQQSREATRQPQAGDQAGMRQRRQAGDELVT